MSWIVDTAMDGIAGGIIGGAVTGIAVWRTLVHERRRARETELRAQVAALHGEASRLPFVTVQAPYSAATPGNPVIAMLRSRALEMYAKGLLVAAQTGASERDFAARASASTGRMREWALTTTPEPGGLATEAAELARLTRAWLVEAELPPAGQAPTPGDETVWISFQ